MTNNKYTPLSLSKKLAALGVEVESEKVWYKAGMLGWQIENRMWAEGRRKSTYRCYTLSDMPEVLKAVGEKKSGHKLNNLGEYTAKVRFEYICSLYYDSPDKAWQYLEDLLDNK